MLFLTVSEVYSQDLTKAEQQIIFQKLKQLDSCNLVVNKLFKANSNLAENLYQRDLEISGLLENYDNIVEKYDSLRYNQSIMFGLKDQELESCKLELKKATHKNWFENLGEVKLLGIKTKYIGRAIFAGGLVYSGYKIGKL